MCGRADETINHLLSECCKMVQKEYKRGHDWMEKIIHWDVCKKNKIQVEEKWYEHEPAPVTENEECKILWDFNVQTDHVIEARRPDMIIIDNCEEIMQNCRFRSPLPYKSKHEGSRKDRKIPGPC